MVKLSPVSEAKKRANNKWVEKNYKRVNLAIRHDEYEIITAYCDERNISKNAFFLEAAREKLEREK